MLDTYSILLVEDMASDAALVEICLRECGAGRIAVAGTLREALIRMASEPPDIVLLDLNLPDSHGLRTIETVVRSRPELPIVVLSGFGADDMVIAAEAVRGGAQDFITKDNLEPAALLRAILFAVERKHQERRRLHHLDHDELTGLPRPHVLARLFESSSSRCARSGKTLALASLGIRAFAQLRDERGAEWADALITAVAARLRKKIRRHDALARQEEARFLALLDNLPGPGHAETAARRLLAVASEPFSLRDSPCEIRLCIGLSRWDTSSPRPFEELRLAAESALERALLRDIAVQVEDAGTLTPS